MNKKGCDQRKIKWTRLILGTSDGTDPKHTIASIPPIFDVNLDTWCRLGKRWGVGFRGNIASAERVDCSTPADPPHRRSTADPGVLCLCARTLCGNATRGARGKRSDTAGRVLLTSGYTEATIIDAGGAAAPGPGVAILGGRDPRRQRSSAAKTQEPRRGDGGALRGRPRVRGMRSAGTQAMRGNRLMRENSQ
jgi:hypothetical protein